MIKAAKSFNTKGTSETQRFTKDPLVNSVQNFVYLVVTLFLITIQSPTFTPMKFAHAFFLICLSILTSQIVFAQDVPRPLTWQELSMVKFEETYDENSGTFYDKPVFPYQLKALEGKEVSILGYVIPMDVELNYYVVSAFPFSSCFFCGGAGPESVVDLQLVDKSLTFENDARITFSGILRLNQGTFFELPYILKEAKIYEEN